jgi:probable rRNA maturation factor
MEVTMNIIFSEERMPGESIVRLFREAGRLCAEGAGLDPDNLEVSVTFVGEDEIQEMNRKFRKKDAVTDVLSFPQFASADLIPANDYVSLGDVVICSEQALLQADDFGHSPERELVYLFVHGAFHLLGYSHGTDEDKSLMREKEEDVLGQLGLVR